MTLLEVISDHIRPYVSFDYTFLQKHNGAMGIVSWCLACHDTFIDAHIGLRSLLDLRSHDLRLKSALTFWAKQIHVSMHVDGSVSSKRF